MKFVETEKSEPLTLVEWEELKIAVAAMMQSAREERFFGDITIGYASGEVYLIRKNQTTKPRALMQAFPPTEQPKEELDNGRSASHHRSLSG